MKKLIFILTLSVLFFVGCKSQKNATSQGIPFNDTTQSFKKEIPTYRNGDVDIFYRLSKEKQKQLGLDSLEKGFINLQIRVWYDFSLIKERTLLVITNRDTVWAAKVYYLQVDWNGRSETILSKRIKNVSPKSGWEAFSKKLLDLNIVTLPDQDQVKGYGGGFDGNSYHVEVATQNQYRFYGYWEPQSHQKQFWQAKNISDILKLFETELGV